MNHAGDMLSLFQLMAEEVQDDRGQVVCLHSLCLCKAWKQSKSDQK